MRFASFTCTLLVPLLCAASFAFYPVVGFAADESEKDSANESPSSEDNDVLAGHSFHGEAFNEGPRQAAYFMPGLEGVEFPASTDSDTVQRFINQGVAQLHGFWYYEAERSFRQASTIDPDCAICYWGMALANVENRERAREFIATAVDKKEGATRREQMYIDAAAKAFRDKDDKGKSISKKDRAQGYTKDLEEIVTEFPDDIEAKAFLGLQLWQNSRSGLPIVSHVAVDSVLQDVFDAKPMHPAHHYRIHLWDRVKAQNAVKSAALCGQSLPAIAHMWHMPGHIYSKLHRYNEAVWQQEASARVDHAHMMRDRVLPDQIHNFAHNNEWLIRNLVKLGRVDDALALAKNMLELPRHPKYNTLSKRGSAKYGRERLVLTLKTYRLWDELLSLAETDYFPQTGDEKLDLERLELMAVAQVALGRDGTAQAELLALQAEEKHELEGLEATLKKLKEEAKSADSKDAPAKEGTDEPTEEAGDDSEEGIAEQCEEAEEGSEESSKVDPKKAAANRKRQIKETGDKIASLKSNAKRISRTVASVETMQLAASGEYKEALRKWRSSNLKDELLKAEWIAASGDVDDAIKQIDKQIDRLPNEVLPIACKAWVQSTYLDNESSLDTFASLRKQASAADLETPLLARLSELAQKAGVGSAWAEAMEMPADFGQRPPLDELGPFRWRPYLAPDFKALSKDGKPFTKDSIEGKPTLMIFYLGFGCLHCVEQLHAFSPRIDDFRNAGIDIVAVSTESVESLNKGLSSFGKTLEIPLHSDESLSSFKRYRCYDDFEQQPLHGTYLIDASGRVLWQDISYEPFMDVDFALKEAKRQLNLHAK